MTDRRSTSLGSTLRRIAPKGAAGSRLLLAMVPLLLGVGLLARHVRLSQVEREVLAGPVAAEDGVARMLATESMHKAVSMAPLMGGADERRSVVREAIRTGTLEVGPGVERARVDALVEAVSAHIAARAAESPEEYLAIVDTERYEWISPSDEKKWHTVEFRWRAVLGAPPDRADPRRVLLDLMRAGLERDSQRLSGIGAASAGSCIRVARITRKAELETALWLGEERSPFWANGPTTTPLVFRTSPTTLERVLARDRSALVARSHQLVEREGGWRVLIVSMWFYDPAAGRWQCSRMTSRGRADYGILF